jgi:hypothetical protein
MRANEVFIAIGSRFVTLSNDLDLPGFRLEVPGTTMRLVLAGPELIEIVICCNVFP